MPRITISVTEGMRAEIEARAEERTKQLERAVPMNEIVIDAIRTYLDRLSDERDTATVSTGGQL